METMVADVMRYTNRYFQVNCFDTRIWVVENGHLRVEPEREPTGRGIDEVSLKEGEWLCFERGSVNSGVWCLGAEAAMPSAADETWRGRVWLLYPPQAFLSLCSRIAAWCAEQPLRPVRSEQFGEYAVEHGDAETWQQHFAADLASWRRMYTVVRI